MEILKTPPYITSLDPKHFVDVERVYPEAGQNTTRLHSMVQDGEGLLVVGNVADTAINGTERKGKKTTLAGGEFYATRGLVGIEDAYLAVPQNMMDVTRSVLEQLRQRGLSTLEDNFLVPIPIAEGRGFTENVCVWLESDEGRAFVDKQRIKALSLFVGHQRADATAAELDLKLDHSGEMSDRLNNKGFHLDTLNKMGCNVPEGKTAVTSEEALLIFHELFPDGKGFGVLKINLSASDYGHFRFCDQASFHKALGEPTVQEVIGEYGVRVERWLNHGKKISDPGAYFYVYPDGRWELKSVANQLKAKKRGEAEATVHMASYTHSRFKDHPDLIRQVEAAAKLVHNQSRDPQTGLGGSFHASLDTIIIDERESTSDPEQIKIYVTEINVRKVGQSHGTERARRLVESDDETDHNSAMSETIFWAVHNNCHVPMAPVGENGEMKGMTVDEIYKKLNSELDLDYTPEKGEGIAVVGNPSQVGTKVEDGKYFALIIAKTQARLNRWLKLVHMDTPNNEIEDPLDHGLVPDPS